MHEPDNMTEGSNSRALVKDAITLDQYMYYAKLKRNAENGDYSGSGYAFLKEWCSGPIYFNAI